MAVLTVWAGSWWLVQLVYGKVSKPSEFGDMFGAVNALFAGLAFAALIAAIYYQREELKLQREELKLQRAELAGQRKQLEEQNRNIRRRDAEDTFFRLLGLFMDALQAIEERGPTSDADAVVHGRKRVKQIESEFRKRADSDFLRGGHQDFKASLETIYPAFYAEHEPDLAVYFKSLRAVLKFLSLAELLHKDAYVEMVRSQLSDSELTLIFYHGLVKDSELGVLADSLELLRDKPAGLLDGLDL